MDNAVQEKFGRVFLLNNGNGYDCLDDATFSNLSLRWHDSQREIHPLFKENAGKPFKVGFELQHTTDKGKTPFEMKLRFPLGLSENRGPDVEYFGKVLQMELSVAMRTGILKNLRDAKCEKIRQAEMSSLNLFRVEGEDVLNYKMVTLVGFALSGDAFVSESSAQVLTRRGYMNPNRMAAPIMEKLREGKRVSVSECAKLVKEDDGEEDEDDELDFTTMVDKMKRAESVLNVLKMLQGEFAKAGGAEQEVTQLWQGIYDILEADRMSKCEAWLGKLSDDDACSAESCIPFQVAVLRELTGFGKLFDIICFQEGIRLKSTTEKMIAVKHMKHLVAELGAKLSSLFSTEKHLASEEFWRSEVTMLQKLRKMSLDEALTKVVEDINRCVEGARGLKGVLLELKGEDEQLERFATTALEMMGAMMQWFLYSRKYHDVSRVDCYV